MLMQLNSRNQNAVNYVPITIKKSIEEIFFTFDAFNMIFCK